jgi:hypothetical protein
MDVSADPLFFENRLDRPSCRQQAEGRFGARVEDRNGHNLDRIYGEIAEELRGKYLLTCTPNVVDNDGGFHGIAVKANKDDLHVVTPEGYFAPGGDSN